jgi:hypothetical protein
MVDIHNQGAKLDMSLERYLKKLYPEDRVDIKRFIEDLQALSAQEHREAIKAYDKLQGIIK